MRGYGRVVGTIGPFLADEPHTFIAGRHFQVQTDGPPNPPEFSQADCVVDAVRRKLLVDVGNLLKVGAAAISPTLLAWRSAREQPRQISAP